MMWSAILYYRNDLSVLGSKELPVPIIFLGTKIQALGIGLSANEDSK